MWSFIEKLTGTEFTLDAPEFLPNGERLCYGDERRLRVVGGFAANAWQIFAEEKLVHIPMSFHAGLSTPLSWTDIVKQEKAVQLHPKQGDFFTNDEMMVIVHAIAGNDKETINFIEKQARQRGYQPPRCAGLPWLAPPARPGLPVLMRRVPLRLALGTGGLNGQL